MTPASELRSGKTDRDENFPVASWIIHKRHRALILAFYNFVRTADDIADHPLLDASTKLTMLDELETGLLGQHDEQIEANTLRAAFAERGMVPRHALDLLTAFRMDVTKLRYADWDELMHYCSFSAMPVGRFMLEVHGEDKATWPASDAICAALQINNHLQDCAKDYRDLDRVYLPQDIMQRHGVSVEALDKPKSSPELLACLRDLVARNEALLREGDSLTVHMVDTRFACNIAVIEKFAWEISKLLRVHDPLSEKVHLSKGSMAGHALAAMAGCLWRRAATSALISRPAAGK